MKKIFHFLFFFSTIAYSQYTQSISLVALTGTASGGGGCTLTIQNNLISLNFSYSFSPTAIQSHFVADILYAPGVPNMNLGYIPTGQNLTTCLLSISNNKLYVTTNGTDIYTYFSGTINYYYAYQAPDHGPYITSSASIENYIKSTEYFTDLGETGSKKTEVAYFDGIGRPKQNVKQYTGGYNIVTNIEYDAFGRQTKEYLPHKIQSTNMEYYLSADDDARFYYEYRYPSNGQNPYTEKIFDNSPLNKVLKQAAPGADWVKNSGHEIKFDYQTNTVNDDIKIYNAITFWDETKGLYDTSFTEGFYNWSGTLNTIYKNVVYDENSSSSPTETNGASVEFVDKEGKVVAKRNYESGIAHDTYYLYDEYGNLTYVLSPKLTTPYPQQIDEFGYQYKYDKKNRLVEKKLPGKQWEYIVYDKLDRVIATGPAPSPFSNNSTEVGWLITKYDVFDRPIITGWMPSTTINTAGRKALQDARNLDTIVSEGKSTTDNTVSGISFRYTTTAFPTIASSYYILTVNYYDDYSFTNPPTIPATIEGETVFFNNTTIPKGFPTSTIVRIPELTTTTPVKTQNSYTLYDYKGRPLRNFTQNYLGGYTQVDTKFNFIGNPIYTITTHKRISTSTVLTLRDDYLYNNYNLLSKHTHSINGATAKLIAENTYNELGQLTSKKVGNTSTLPLQTVDYRYNIRGWLTNINDLSLIPASKDIFAYKINYNTVQNESGYTGTPLYNGNISETYWKALSDATTRKYGYKYDDLNRLEEAIYQKPGNAVPVPNSYNESLTYDKNGNILTLHRNGNVDGVLPAVPIDDLTYTYNTNSNKLVKVTDNPATATSGFNDFANTAIEFDYDANGNMIRDDNKKITSITYNHLNLPLTITFGLLGTIAYTYDALGQKLKKVVSVTSPASVTTTDYLDGFQYQGAVLQFFPTPEGYVKNTSGVYSYVFNYTDHLGNVRLTYSDLDNNGTIALSEILEENHYYPFGLIHNGYNNFAAKNNASYKYKYNGKELQNELGLNMYDYGARNYDPALGRWMNIDPLAEKYFGVTPYNYVCNNPINAIDPDGMDIFLLTESGKTILALKEKNKKEDTLYAVKNGSVNPVTKEQSSPSIYNMKDTNGDGQYDIDDGVTVKSGLIGQLTKSSGSDKNGSYNISVGKQNENENDYLNLFYYISNNAKKNEFSLEYYTVNNQNWMQLGTYNLYDKSPCAFAKNSTTTLSYHNHSDTENNRIIEFTQMGAYPNGKQFFDGQWRDFDLSRENKTPYTKYVYYANSKRLYSVTQYTVKYVKKINKANDFKQ